MTTVVHNNFGGGMANDIYKGRSGEFSATRNFDILSFPNKLYPLPSLQSGTASTGIMNLLTASDGTVYGLSNSASGALWARNGSNTFVADAGYGSGATVSTDFFVEYKRYGSKYLLFYDTTAIAALDPVAHTSASAATFTATYIGQGFVHPKDNVLYVPYEISGTTVVGTMTATVWAPAVLTLPSQYRIVGLTNWGNYLAIACNLKDSNGLPQGNSTDSSVVFLWDTVASTWNESFNWGDNILQVFNNLNGVLVGCSRNPDPDNASLLIRGYSGGEVETLLNIPAIKQTSTDASVTFNTRVNFIHRNRLYFSADLDGGSTSPSHKGLWSFGKNKEGRYVCTVERFGSTDGSDVSVLAATFRTGYLHIVHTSAGTLTNNDGSFSQTLTTRYASASVWESVVNPEMPEEHRHLNKKLNWVGVTMKPMTSSGTIVVKYRVDVDGNSSNWTTVFTKTYNSPDTNLTFYKTRFVSGAPFTDGVSYEFRVESTGKAEVTGLLYDYEVKPLL